MVVVRKYSTFAGPGHQPTEGIQYKKMKRLLSNRFTTARLSSIERWYAPCADSGNTFLPLNLPSSDGVRRDEAVFQ